MPYVGGICSNVVKVEQLNEYQGRQGCDNSEHDATSVIQVMSKISLLNDVGLSVNLHGESLPETVAWKVKMEGAARGGIICSVLVRCEAVAIIGACSGLAVSSW